MGPEINGIGGLGQRNEALCCCFPNSKVVSVCVIHSDFNAATLNFIVLLL